MDWIAGHWTMLIGPAVVAALVSGIVAVIGFFITTGAAKAMHREKLAFDERQAERRTDAEIALAEKSFSLDCALADRKRKQDLAEEVLAGFYRVNDLVLAIRAPVSFANEVKDRRKPDGESQNVGWQRDTYYPVIARFEERRQEIAELLAKRFRMSAWFGKAADEPFQLLDEALNDIIVSAQFLVQWSGDGTQEADPALWKKMQGDVWWGKVNPDPVATKIADAIGKMDTICRPILEGKAI